MTIIDITSESVDIPPPLPQRQETQWNSHLTIDTMPAVDKNDSPSVQSC